MSISRASSGTILPASFSFQVRAFSIALSPLLGSVYSFKQSYPIYLVGNTVKKFFRSNVINQRLGLGLTQVRKGRLIEDLLHSLYPSSPRFDQSVRYGR